MARKSSIIDNTWNMVLTVPCSKYFITMGLRSMKWDEWIGKILMKATSTLETYTYTEELNLTITIFDITPTKTVESKNGARKAAKLHQKRWMVRFSY